MENVRKLPKCKAIRYFASDIAKGFFNGLIGNYLLYVYQPVAQSGIPSLMPGSKLFGFITIMALLTGISKVIDAVTDPLVASLSDKWKGKGGRRMPFLRLAAVPYALSVLMVFMAPFPAGSAGNAVWVGFFLVAYYVFYTIFYIPHRALVPEVIPDAKERVGIYAVSTAFFMGSSAVMYATPLYVSWFKSAGISTLWAWRTVFVIFAVVGLACLLLTAFAFNEKDYVQSVRPQDSFFRSVGVVFKNKQFVLFTLGDLCNYIAMAFFQTTMLYYVTVLIRIPEDQAFIVMLVAIVTAIALFPLITRICNKRNKKTPLLVASWMFAVIFAAIFFGDKIALLFEGVELVLGVLMGLCVAYPFAAINMIPQAVVSDIIQADSLTEGRNREGIFSATKTFIEKIGSAVAMIIVSSVLAVGAAAGAEVGLTGIKLTGLFAAGFSLLSAVFFLFYNDKAVTRTIVDGLARQAYQAAPTEDGYTPTQNTGQTKAAACCKAAQRGDAGSAERDGAGADGAADAPEET